MTNKTKFTPSHVGKLNGNPIEMMETLTPQHGFFVFVGADNTKKWLPENFFTDIQPIEPPKPEVDWNKHVLQICNNVEVSDNFINWVPHVLIGYSPERKMRFKTIGGGTWYHCRLIEPEKKDSKVDWEEFITYNNMGINGVWRTKEEAERDSRYSRYCEIMSTFRIVKYADSDVPEIEVVK